MKINPLDRIAGMSRKAQEHRRNGRTAESDRVQAKADALALQTLREHPFFQPDCQPCQMAFNLKKFMAHSEAIRHALDGGAPIAPRPDAINRVLDAANDFWREHGHAPTRNDLIEMGIRGEDVSTVTKKISGIVKPGKPGPKPN